MSYNADDVYWQLANLNLSREIDEIKSDLQHLINKIDKFKSDANEDLLELQQTLLSFLREKLEPEAGDSHLDAIHHSLDFIKGVSSNILETVERPEEEDLIWPPLIGQVVTLQGWDYPHVVKAVEIEDATVKYLVGASTRRDDPRDVLVRLNELVPYKW
ncbi:hypothetical protein [Pseudomonas plecoglossicida]|uniref:hypothetical protein n=1 Tax=Pseudomonas plecoglossicida TaxID=70775 RepID=UPI0005A17207|nr:hypothetical protein [Pseudomonas plecoglossicida]